MLPFVFYRQRFYCHFDLLNVVFCWTRGNALTCSMHPNDLYEVKHQLQHDALIAN